MLPTDTTLRTMIDERESEIQGELRRTRLLRQASTSGATGGSRPLRSWLGAILRRHRVRDLRHALANTRR